LFNPVDQDLLQLYHWTEIFDEETVEGFVHPTVFPSEPASSPQETASLRSPMPQRGIQSPPRLA
jgi:hypothetical protein